MKIIAKRLSSFDSRVTYEIYPQSYEIVIFPIDKLLKNLQHPAPPYIVVTSSFYTIDERFYSNEVDNMDWLGLQNSWCAFETEIKEIHMNKRYFRSFGRKVDIMRIIFYQHYQLRS